MPSALSDARITRAPSEYTDAIVSNEWAIHPKLPIYAGGLGVLAADQLKEAADRGLPLIGIGVLYHKGWVRQELDASGVQIDREADVDPKVYEELGLQLAKIGSKPVLEKIVIDGNNVREVNVGAYIFPVNGKRSILPLFLGTTNILENTNVWDKGLTARLYDNGNGHRDYYRTIQFRVLAAVRRIAQRLGYNVKYQLNDGHGAFIILDMMNEDLSDDQIRENVWFTTHTPEAAAFDYFTFDQVATALPTEYQRLWPHRVNHEGVDKLGMAEFAIEFSRGINAVSRMHAEVAAQMPRFQGRQIFYATNGVHLPTWVHPAKARVYKDYLVNPFENPNEFRRSESIDDGAFDKAHRQAKGELVDLVRSRTGHQLDYDNIIFGFARRGVVYKRADLLVRDIEALARVINGYAQIIFASKVPPGDDGGKHMIQTVYQRAAELRREYGAHVVFVPDHDILLGQALVGGVDGWFNVPLRGHEASGTSGMKVSANGGINISVLDGWWPEGYNGRNGFAIGPYNYSSDPDIDFRHALAILEFEAIPALRDIRARNDLRRESIKLAADFNTFRQLQDLRRSGAHTYPLERILGQERAA